MTLKAQMAVDRDTFLNRDEFATEAEYTGSNPITGATEKKTINVIFDGEYQAIDPITGEVESSGPRAISKTSDFENVSHGDTLEINGVIYKVIEVQKDGEPQGFITLILSKD